eukprot:TRINITY_DN255_c0_g1_i1.p1 TRINITY_DN255_c0_g1~~TRINITY_DN255_c0_g1_i1.p1  ORF type:complete len:232 (-),score=43.15 TRINITY_DN255_c0_g1_i1:83-778(-)
MYRGLNVALVNSATSWSIYMAVYNACKRFNSSEDGRSDTMTDALVASIATILATNPLQIIRTRMVLYDNEAQRVNNTRFRLFPALRAIVQQDGFSGLYRGLTTSLFAIPQWVLQMTLYERLKQSLIARHANDNKAHDSNAHQLDTIEVFAAAGASKLLSTAVAYPYQVIRSRVMDIAAPSTSPLTTLRLLLQHDGVSGLYKGMAPQLLRVVPHAAIALTVYESVSAAFRTA